jgi:hypothetical protein
MNNRLVFCLSSTSLVNFLAGCPDPGAIDCLGPDRDPGSDRDLGPGPDLAPDPFAVVLGNCQNLRMRRKKVTVDDGEENGRDPDPDNDQIYRDHFCIWESAWNQGAAEPDVCHRRLAQKYAD